MSPCASLTSYVATFATNTNGDRYSGMYTAVYTGAETTASPIVTSSMEAYAANVGVSAAATSCASYVIRSQGTDNYMNFQLRYDQAVNSYYCDAYRDANNKGAMLYTAAAPIGANCVYGYHQYNFADLDI